MEFDFRRVLGLDLLALMRTRSWRWFRVMVAGLLATPDSTLHRRFLARKEPEKDPHTPLG